ncbi:LysR family transcriptional regulator [Noviherbaspirillum sp. Root189]|uniref:LysR family transcriptional regulator n=1 Tax=Noviherbaspirillum sp. Root189 TaxID=1736487 RepID=UPI00070FA1E4|nr:LysR substrate-binding domain-containing protein [Noviherbaspirillum sp. Root189]KRB92307.1 LysR family transcriptional regulator [Noviherbaspirillum sp. Root189]
MHFDLTDLRLMIAIAESGSLSRAAADFPIALSAASNRLRLLEQRIGMPLFMRHADGMTPTPAGRIALDHARRVVAESVQLGEALQALSGQQRVRVRIAANTVANSTFLPPALGPFLKDFPEVDLQIEELPSDQILRALLSDNTDVGVLDGNLQLTGIVSLPFRHDRLVLLVPQDHPLAARHDCLLRDALGYAFIGMPAERALQHFVEEMATMLGKPPTVRVRAPGFFAIAQLVAQGAGIAVLPEAAAKRHSMATPTVIVALNDPWATRELRLCVRNLDGLSAQARQLVAYLSDIHAQ